MLVLTLCACQQTYDVTFELGYDNKTEVKTYDKGAKVDFSPTRTDYDFGGWFKDEALTQPWGDSAVEADVTLYAKWTPKVTTQVTVTLDYNYHGAPSPKQETITAGTAYTPEVPQRTNYDFLGWFTDSSFSPPPFSNGTVVNEDITLYAKWQVKPEVQVDVTLNLNYDGAPAPTVVSIAKGETLYAENPTRDEYEFKGWYLEATLETPFDVTTQINEDITLYAKWEVLPELRFELSADGNSYSVSAGTFKGGELVIPAAYEGKPVTEVKAEGFKNVGATKVCSRQRDENRQRGICRKQYNRAYRSRFGRRTGQRFPRLHIRRGQCGQRFGSSRNFEKAGCRRQCRSRGECLEGH